MNLMWLQTFNIIVEKGSLTKAARALHLTQPAVSKQLRALEEYYGTPLVRRTTRELELTEAGKVVYSYGRRALDLIMKSREDVQAFVSTVCGELLLGASTIPGEYILPRFLGSFQQHYPEVRVKMEIGDSKEIASKVLEGDLELGIIGAVIKNRGLSYEVFCSDELVAIVSVGHRFAGRETITLNEFIAEPFVAREAGSGTRIVIDKWLMTCGIEPSSLKFRLELGSTEAVLNAVSEGIGISVVSRYAAQSRVQTGELACLRIAGFPSRRWLYFITKKNSEPKPLVKTFMKFLKDQCPVS